MRKTVLAVQPRGILEVGGGTGEGSTTALIGHGCPVWSIEPDAGRYAQLARRLEGHGVAIHDCATAGIMQPTEVEIFYHNTRTNLNQYPLATVLGWLEESQRQMRELPCRGIETAKRLGQPDMVLLDGSPFSGMAELWAVLDDARVIALDDTNDIKHWQSSQYLRHARGWRLVWDCPELRNGAAIFERR